MHLKKKPIWNLKRKQAFFSSFFSGKGRAFYEYTEAKASLQVLDASIQSISNGITEFESLDQHYFPVRRGNNPGVMVQGSLMNRSK